MIDQTRLCRITLFAGLAICCVAGCSNQYVSTNAVVVRQDLGIICIGPGQQAAEAKTLNSISRAAKALGLTQSSMESSGSPELSRTAYSFVGPESQQVNVEFTNRTGSDLRILVTAPPSARAEMTDAIWSDLSTQLEI